MAGGPFALLEPHLAKIAAHVAALWVTHVTSVWLGLLGPTDTDRRSRWWARMCIQPQVAPSRKT